LRHWRGSDSEVVPPQQPQQPQQRGAPRLQPVFRLPEWPRPPDSTAPTQRQRQVARPAWVDWLLADGAVVVSGSDTPVRFGVAQARNQSVSTGVAKPRIPPGQSRATSAPGEARGPHVELSDGANPGALGSGAGRRCRRVDTNPARLRHGTPARQTSPTPVGCRLRQGGETVTRPQEALPQWQPLGRQRPRPDRLSLLPCRVFDQHQAVQVHLPVAVVAHIHGESEYPSRAGTLSLKVLLDPQSDSLSLLLLPPPSFLTPGLDALPQQDHVDYGHADRRPLSH